MPRALLVAALIALPSFALPASGQTTSRPGVDCSLLTVSQAQHWLESGLCVTPPRPDPVQEAGDATTLIDAACTPRPNPYTEPDRATLCNLLSRTAPRQAPAFELGGLYRHAYPSQVLLVTELRMEHGATMVIGRWAAHSDAAMIGKVYTFTAGTEPFERVDSSSTF